MSAPHAPPCCDPLCLDCDGPAQRTTVTVTQVRTAPPPVAELVEAVRVAGVECDAALRASHAIQEQLREASARHAAAKLALLKAQRALLLGLVGQEAMVP